MPGRSAVGAGTASFQGTRAYGLSEGGSISGWYIDPAGVVHGYVRANNGSFTTFDAPNAGTGPYPQGTFPFGFNSINNAGAITGYANDVNGSGHGFLRTPAGTFVTFDVPGAGTLSGEGTYPWAINQSGVITGYVWDVSSMRRK